MRGSEIGRWRGRGMRVMEGGDERKRRRWREIRDRRKDLKKKV